VQETKTLGKLVTFDKHRLERRPRPAKTGEAEVILFTGIRYERDKPRPDKPPATSGSKRGRG
jgi:hypothetical protein